MSHREVPVVFDCEDDVLVGIASVPPAPKRVGVLIVVGGPQYRVGSHRQFTLLARALAEHDFAAFRFDFRGMGDSTGAMRSFEAIEEDIVAAANAFRATLPNIKELVIWGLCDAASAALMTANRVEGLRALILANPWVRDERSHNRSVVHHYYFTRPLSLAFWAKLVRGEIAVSRALGEFIQRTASALAFPDSSRRVADSDFVCRMREGWLHFEGPRLVILSGQDLTAREFEDLTATDERWRLSGVERTATVFRLGDADHTFSTAEHRMQVEETTCRFLNVLARGEFLK